MPGIGASTSRTGASDGHGGPAKDPPKGPVGQIRAIRPLTPLKDFKVPKLHTAPKRASAAWPGKFASHDYEAVLLAHAKLYILSYSQEINALTNLCISRLHRVLKELSQLPIDPLILKNVVELLKYAYCTPRNVATPEPLQSAWAELQNVTSQFCALNIDAMDGSQEFKELMQEGGVLATDMMAKTIRRLMSAESDLAKANDTVAVNKAPPLVRLPRTCPVANKVPPGGLLGEKALALGKAPTGKPVFAQSKRP
jgi:hypothetical protein